MEPTLVAVTLLSLAMAVAMGLVTWRLLRAERRRSDARVAALDDLSAVADPPGGGTASPPGRAEAETRVFADLPQKDPAAGQIDNQPDGMCLDAAGNLYVAHYGMKQVQVLSPEGKLIRRYPGGNVTTSNVAFGGPQLVQLFVTGGLGPESGKGGLFRLDLGVAGLRILPTGDN